MPVVIIHQPRISMSVDGKPDELKAITSCDNVLAYIMSLNYQYECRLAQFVA